MTRLLVAALLILLAAAPAAAETRRLPVGDFDRVIVEGPYEVRLVTGRASSATATGRRDSLDRLSVDVQGMTLRIRRNRTGWTGTPGADPGIVIVALTTRALRSVRLVGPARFEADGVRGLNLELSVEGSGAIRVGGIDTDRLALALLGSGRIEVAGEARTLSGNFQGNGEIAAAALTAGSAVLASSSGGEIVLRVTGGATIAHNGLGAIRILGRPACALSGVGAERVLCGGSDQRQDR